MACEFLVFKIFLEYRVLVTSLFQPCRDTVHNELQIHKTFICTICEVNHYVHIME